jgi:hypothetical protein
MSEYTCPYCGGELTLTDRFGKRLTRPDSEVLGDIYDCKNLDENGHAFDCYNTSFYTRYGNDELIEGHPC